MCSLQSEMTHPQVIQSAQLQGVPLAGECVHVGLVGVSEQHCAITTRKSRVVLDSCHWGGAACCFVSRASPLTQCSSLKSHFRVFSIFEKSPPLHPMTLFAMTLLCLTLAAEGGWERRCPVSKRSQASSFSLRFLTSLLPCCCLSPSEDPLGGQLVQTKLLVSDFIKNLRKLITGRILFCFLRLPSQVNCSFVGA